MKDILLTWLVGSACGLAIGVLLVLPEDAAFTAEPMTTVSDNDHRGRGWWWSDSPEALHRARLDTDCSATFTDAATERALMPVYFYSLDNGQCEESAAWARLRATTTPKEYEGAKLVTRGTPLGRWLRCEESSGQVDVGTLLPGQSATVSVEVPCVWTTDRIR